MVESQPAFYSFRCIIHNCFSSILIQSNSSKTGKKHVLLQCTNRLIIQLCKKLYWVTSQTKPQISTTFNIFHSYRNESSWVVAILISSWREPWYRCIINTAFAWNHGGYRHTIIHERFSDLRVKPKRQLLVHVATRGFYMISSPAVKWLQLAGGIFVIYYIIYVLVLHVCVCVRQVLKSAFIQKTILLYDVLWQIFYYCINFFLVLHVYVCGKYYNLRL